MPLTTPRSLASAAAGRQRSAGHGHYCFNDTQLQTGSALLRFHFETKPKLRTVDLSCCAMEPRSMRNTVIIGLVPMTVCMSPISAQLSTGRSPHCGRKDQLVNSPKNPRRMIERDGVDVVRSLAAHNKVIVSGLMLLSLFLIPLSALHWVRLFGGFLVVVIREFKHELRSCAKIIRRIRRELTSWEHIDGQKEIEVPVSREGVRQPQMGDAVLDQRPPRRGARSRMPRSRGVRGALTPGYPLGPLRGRFDEAMGTVQEPGSRRRRRHRRLCSGTR
ncbi:MAG: hypothetical protein JWN02_631 [Acidobacteria bacterium]|nr:hypothetical protein [Acidobacteriota bacterium]